MRTIFYGLTGELEISEESFDDTTATGTEVMDPMMMHSYTDMADEICEWGVGKYGIEEIPPAEIKSSENVDENGDPAPEFVLKPSKPHGYIELEKALEKLDESKEMMDIADFEFAGNPNALDMTKLRAPSSPNAEEVSRFINDKSAYIEDVFKCMLRGISNSKLNIVKNNCWGTLSSITELDDETDSLDDDSGNKDDGAPLDGAALPGTSETSVAITPEMKIRQLIRNLDYFIDILCSIKSSDAKDTYSIIVLYEKLIFDIKSEISSLSKSLKIYRTIVGKGVTN